ncbi:MAG: dehydrogenase subunit [Proteobacteria bacterium]|nr:dehydrogenase subunit [Pseudomonadota bacterium]
MLSKESREKFEREIAKFPADQRQSAVVACLAIAQEELGWLAPETIEFVANYLDMPPVAAWEVATFYSMFELKPVGRYKLTVCTNLSCSLSGARHAAEYLKSKLGIGFGETTADGKFTLKEAECMGACGDAPVLLVNNHHMCCRMNPEKIDQLLEECK